MKEYISKEIKPGKYEYAYKIQKIDIEFMIELGLNVPDKIKQIYGQGFKESELKEYIYFDEPNIVDFISRQYYIRNIEEFTNLNLFEIDKLIDKYKMNLLNLLTKKNQILDKEQLNDIDIDIKVLVNELLGVIYLRNELLSIENDKIR